MSLRAIAWQSHCAWYKIVQYRYGRGGPFTFVVTKVTKVLLFLGFFAACGLCSAFV
jgi:hypothetical protein